MMFGTQERPYINYEAFILACIDALLRKETAITIWCDSGVEGYLIDGVIETIGNVHRLYVDGIAFAWFNEKELWLYKFSMEDKILDAIHDRMRRSGWSVAERNGDAICYSKGLYSESDLNMEGLL